MSTIKQNIHNLQQDIRKATQDWKRDPTQITLLAVSKNRPVTAIEAAIAAGQQDFGENYVQEGIKKILWFRDRPQGQRLIWHFIGSLQSNKSRLVAEYFDWFHTLDRPNLARRLNDQRPKRLAPLNILIQINITGEEKKSGINPDKLAELTKILSECPRLKFRGLMSIPAPEKNFLCQFSVFHRLGVLYKQVQRTHSTVDTLSLGMTNDMEAAIAAGSTLVRIGTKIFGAKSVNAVFT